MSMAPTPITFDLPEPSPVVERVGLHVPLRALSITQEGDYLCWAACVESAARSQGVKHLYQSEIAARTLGCGPTLCRQDLRDPSCDRDRDADQITDIWHGFGFKRARRSGKPKDLAEMLRAQLTGPRPVQVWIEERHVVLVYGYLRKKDGREEVLVMDPQRNYLDQWQPLPSFAEKWNDAWTELDLLLC